MPNPIDRCAACQQPLYIEANVAGGCDCQDRDFRILLAQQRHRNSTGNEDFASAFVAAPPPDLSEVDPGILMSAAGRSEYENAQQLRGRTRFVAHLDDAAVFGPTAGTVTDDARTMLENSSYGPPAEDVFAQEPMVEEEEDDWTGLSASQQQHHRHNARVANVAARMDNVDLAAMWLEGTGIPFDRAQLAAPAGDGFEFDTGEMAVDTAAYPRGGGVGGGRFRVDGGRPPRTAFNREMINNQGPMTEGGRVRGRFAVLREQQPAPEVNFAAIRAEAAPPPPREAPRAPTSAVQQARALQSTSKGPSVYDLIRRNPLGK
jgi:hypothetical protein